jgi:hypothetical protein
MPKDREPIEALNAGALAANSKIRFEDCNFTAEETQRILAVGTTTLFDKLLRNRELESYLEGTRRIITGRSILAYRERKLAEAQKLPTPQFTTWYRRKKTATPSRGAPSRKPKIENEKRRSRETGSAP